MMMTIALRFIPTLMEETDRIIKAQTARGADFSGGNLLVRAKNRLCPMHRKCYELLADGKSHEEIALLTGTTISNVGVVAHRMRKQFRTNFEEVA